MIKVFVNGTFDILHTGHLSLLNKAKSLGDYLLVACDSDDRVKQLKGDDRPICNQTVRSSVLANLKAVDEVKIFETSEQLEKIIEEYQPDVMIVGSDWKGKPVIGSQFAKKLIYYSRVNDESTTQTIENFIARRSMR